MERYDSPFIEVRLPQNIIDNDGVIDGDREHRDVFSVIRNAMHEIGYEYYNNDGGRIFRYAPATPPIEYHFDNEVRKALKEELSKSDVRSMISSELNDFLKKQELKRQMKNIAADVVEEFLDNLWKRKSFWKGTINRN